MTKGLVSQWRSGERQEMGFDAATRLNKKYGYAVNWLVNGSGVKLDSDRSIAQARGAGISDQGLEIGLAYDQLSVECQEHVTRQIELLRMADTHNGRRAAQHDAVIKNGVVQSDATRKRRRS